jgi:hypothetical protein
MKLLFQQYDGMLDVELFVTHLRNKKAMFRLRSVGGRHAQPKFSVISMDRTLSHLWRRQSIMLRQVVSCHTIGFS